MNKKIATLLLAIGLIASMAVPAFAAGFTSSVEGKDAPEVVTQTGEYGRKYAALIVDEKGNEIAGVSADDLTVTPVSQTNKADAGVRKKLENAYKQLQDAKSLTELSGDLPSVVKEAAPGATMDDLVVRDLFDVSISKDQAETLKKEGASISIRFSLSADAQSLAAVLHNTDGNNWETIPNNQIKRNKDNTVDVKFTSLSPVAFVFDGGKLGVDPNAPLSPQTGEPELSVTVSWIVAGGVAALAVASFMVIKKRSSQKV